MYKKYKSPSRAATAGIATAARFFRSGTERCKIEYAVKSIRGKPFADKFARRKSFAGKYRRRKKAFAGVCPMETALPADVRLNGHGFFAHFFILAYGRAVDGI